MRKLAQVDWYHSNQHALLSNHDTEVLYILVQSK